MMNEPKTTPNARRVFLRFPKWFGDFKVDDKDIEAGEGEETCDRVTSVRRGFRKVRSFIKTPTDEVRLEDILNGRHLPPLTLEEFEGYLIHVERAPENLFFFMWLDDYARYYREWEASLVHKSSDTGTQQTPKYLKRFQAPHFTIDQDFSTSHLGISNQHTNLSLHTPLPHDLLMSKTIALRAFFDSQSQMELNLSDEVSRKTSLDALVTSDPSIFRHVRKEVVQMLEESMRRWLVRASGNADDKRVGFAIGVGIVGIAMAILLAIILIRNSPQRCLRFTSIPLFWTSFATLVAGLYRTCPIIFIFGSWRQIHSWELLRELQPQSSFTLAKHYLGYPPHQSAHSIPTKALILVPIREACYVDRFSHQFSNWISSGESPTVTTRAMRRESGGTCRHHGIQDSVSNSDFDRLLNHHRRWFMRCKPTQPTDMFAPVTKVLSPIVKQAQRLNILKSLGWSTFAVVFWSLVLLLPFKSSK